MENNESSQFSEKPEWFILNDGNHVGPFSGQKIADYYAEGNLRESSLVWRGGNKDWLPLNMVDEFKELFYTEGNLPELPDIREIEREARVELEKDFPLPSLKRHKPVNLRSKDTDSEVLKKYKSLKEVSKDSVGFESRMDSETGEIFDTVSLPDLPSFKIPSTDEISSESVVKDNDAERKIESSLLVEDLVDDLKEDTSEKIGISETGDIPAESNDNLEENNYFKQFILIFTFAFIFLTPGLVYFYLSSPVSFESPHLSDIQNEQIEQMINGKSKGDQKVIGFIGANNNLFLGVNATGQIEIEGSLKSLRNQITTLGDLRASIVGLGENGVVEFKAPGFEKSSVKSFPIAGRYEVKIKVKRERLFDWLFVYLKKIKFINELPWVKGFQKEFTIDQEITIGRGLIPESEKLIGSFLKDRNELIIGPTDHLNQQLQTLDTLLKQFKELFFNSTTFKTYAKSKTYFSRKFGREFAPVLQAISLFSVQETGIQPKKIGKSVSETFSKLFEESKIFSKEVSGLAAYADKVFSKDDSWNSTKRIRQRRAVNKELSKLKKRINNVSKQVQALRQKYILKIN